MQAAQNRIYKIGTRGSQLALKQTEMVCEKLKQHDPAIQLEQVEIRTAGDWSPDKGETRLDPNEGGKGQFIGKIEEHLSQEQIDIAVHSLKDVPSDLTDEFSLEHFLPGGDARDAFISENATHPSDLPDGSVIGTASLRRQALIKRYWPTLNVVVIRGNVPTRLQKLDDGQVDALILAAAGLERLNLLDRIASYLDSAEFIPCGGQGIIATEIRSNDPELKAKLDPIDCPHTHVRAVIERSFLSTIGGSCHTPVGIHAETSTSQSQWKVNAFVGDPEGRYNYFLSKKMTVQDVEQAHLQGVIFAQEFLTKVSHTHRDELGLTGKPPSQETAQAN